MGVKTILFRHLRCLNAQGPMGEHPGEKQPIRDLLFRLSEVTYFTQSSSTYPAVDEPGIKVNA